MLLEIDRTWTLFLDRDGVLNRKLAGDYVRSPQDLVLLPDVAEALLVLRPLFGRIIVVTNQQGIGKGLMSETDLNQVHEELYRQLGTAAHTIDRIYHCPDLATTHSPCRKPQIGMAQQAQQDFPEIDLSRSIIVGDSPSDMEFGRRAGMQTVFVGTDPVLIRQQIGQITAAVSDLFAFTSLLYTKNR
ncbi:MAG: D-glycero-alpha-D-manno-heptose-1,7-bisphosphate 7-phosphatase [Bernardetiaceae bacterium]